MLEGLDAAGFILVGGRSSRMGADKAFLPFRSMPLGVYIARQLAPVADHVSVVGDPERHARLGLPVVADEYPGAGPVGAVISALRSTGSTWNIVTACDMPGVSTEVFKALLEKARVTAAQAVIPVTPDGNQQVLCAAYHRNCLEPLASAFSSGERSLRRAVHALTAEFCHAEGASCFANVNTPEEFAAFRGDTSTGTGA